MASSKTLEPGKAWKWGKEEVVDDDLSQFSLFSPSLFLSPNRMDIPVKFELWTSGMLHGLAFWFDVAFIGSE